MTMTKYRKLLIAAIVALAGALSWAGVTTVVFVQPVAAGGGTPTVSSVVLDKSGTYATITFSESVTVGAGGNGGVAATLSSGTTTATYLSGSGSTALVYSCWPPVMPSVTATWAYTQPGGGLEATTGGADVATFSSQASTNNSTALVWFDMEGAGYGGSGESWTEDIATDGTIDEDYTTSVISGSQSLFLDEGTGGDVLTYVDLGSGYGALAMRLQHKIGTVSGVNLTAHPCATFYDSGGTSRAGIRYNFTNATATCAIVARIATTSGTAGTTTWTGTDSVYMWLDYSNTDDVVNAHWSSTLIKPPTDGEQSSTVSTSVTASVRRVGLAEVHATERRLFDNLVVWVP